jgi:pathogenesis-related protein 1
MLPLKARAPLLALFLAGAATAQPPLAPPGPIAEGTLATHNKARAAVGTPPLKWSSATAQAAQKWADHLAATGKVAHDPDDHYGQNIWASTRPRPINVVIEQAISEEQPNYEPVTGSCIGGKECHHYTQIVWEGTTQVGCAHATRPDPQWGQWEYWVCNYDPPGNWNGVKAYP